MGLAARGFCVACGALAFAGGAFAQSGAQSGTSTDDLSAGQDAIFSPILTLDQDGLYRASMFGQRVQSELEAASTSLSSENRRIEAALIEEEQRLTDEREGMDPTEFRALAEDFDQRVTGIRRAQDQKAKAIQRDAEAERARFFELAFPVLLELVEETGALAILDNSAVIFSVRQIDITALAVERVDAELGAAPRPVDSGLQPSQRPDLATPDPEVNTETNSEQE